MMAEPIYIDLMNIQISQTDCCLSSLAHLYSRSLYSAWLIWPLFIDFIWWLYIMFSLADLIIVYRFWYIMAQPICIDPINIQISQTECCLSSSAHLYSFNKYSDQPKWVFIYQVQPICIIFNLAHLTIVYRFYYIMAQHIYIHSINIQISQSECLPIKLSPSVFAEFTFSWSDHCLWILLYDGLAHMHWSNKYSDSQSECLFIKLSPSVFTEFKFSWADLTIAY